MRSALISEMAQFEEKHFWYWGKRRLIRKLIQRYKTSGSLPSLLDVGSGTGRLLDELSDIAICKGVDASHRAVKLTKKRGYIVEKGDATNLPFSDNTFDLVVLSDVLEHIKDDQSALAEVFRVLKHKGYAIITVPAHAFLYGSHDKALSHFRRYDKKTLQDRLYKAKFSLRKITPTNMLLLIPALMAKSRENPQSSQVRRGNLPAPLNCIARFWYRIETFLVVYATLPFGLSLLAVVQKPEQ